jgi:hypothetical protein
VCGIGRTSYAISCFNTFDQIDIRGKPHRSATAGYVKKGSMDWIYTLIKIVGSAMSALLPAGKQRMAERKAGIFPESVQHSITDQVLNGALDRLGTIDANDSIWSQCTVGVQSMFMRPETFRKPAVREWLSRKSVQDDLKATVQAKLGQSPLPADAFQRLVEQYQDATGEDHRFAKGAITIAVAFLQASVHGAVRDLGTAALVQATAVDIKVHVDAGFATLAESAGLAMNPFESERSTHDARRQLNKVLRRRATPGQNTLLDIRKLVSDLENGRPFSAAENSAKQEIRYWCARIEAANGNADAAHQLLTTLSERGFAVPSAAWALIDVAKGDPNAALRWVRNMQDPESRATIFHIRLKAEGANAALDYFDSQKHIGATAFTSVGWNNVCAVLFSEGRFDDGIKYLTQLPAAVRSACTHLEYMHAIACLLPMVPPDRRESVMRSGFSSIADHVLDGPAATVARAVALQAAEAALRCAQEAEDHVIAERCESGIRGLRLFDPALRDAEIASIRAAMTDGPTAVKLIWLVRAYDIAFDTAPLERYLSDSRQMGGLTTDQLRAELYLLTHPERSAELVRFLDEEWGNLLPNNDPEQLTVMKVQALATLGDIDGATAFFDAHRELIGEAVADRLDLMLRGARGEDASDTALALFRKTSAIEDLTNLVQILELKRHWKRLAPYSSELYLRESNYETAMLQLRCLRRTKASAKDIRTFLEGTVGQVAQKPDIRSARAWALFDDGDHLAAKILNDELLATRCGGADIALDINIAIRTGDWDRFPSITAKAFEKRDQLHSQMLLSFAKLVGFTDTTQALALAQEAVDRDGAEPAILIGAHSVAIAAQRDDIAMPLIQRAASLSKEGGPITMFSHRELVEFMRGNADSWRHKNEMYRTAQVPLHMAATMFNAPLTQMLIAVPRGNASQADPRRRQPIPIRAGRRQQVAADGFRSIALDITTLFVLHEIGRLGDVIQSYETILISPRVMDVLLEDRAKVAFHQPSRIADVKPLITLLGAGRLHVVATRGPEHLVNEIGDEAASLLAAARKGNGCFVHPGKLFKVASFMEDEANLGDMALRFVDTVDVACALKAEGVITQVSYEKSIEYLTRTGAFARNAIAPVSALFLDGLSVQYLQQAKLLLPLLNSGHAVSIHKSTVDEWRALLATEPQTAEMTTALNALRLTLRDGLMSGKVRFLTQSRRQRGKLNETAWLPVMDLFEDIALADAAVVDDRMLAANALITDANGHSIPTISSLDLIDALVARKIMSDDARRGALHILRERCFFCIPIYPADLLFYIENAGVEDEVLRETAELRVIREYLFRLHSTDVLCTEGDLEYLGSVWHCGIVVIAQLWANDAVPINVVIAKSNWISENVIPSIELAMRFAVDGPTRIGQVAAAQMGAMLQCHITNPERRHAHAKWLEEARFADFFPANGHVVEEVASQAADDLVRRTREVAIELERKNSATATE